jgi:hypothetical protein
LPSSAIWKSSSSIRCRLASSDWRQGPGRSSRCSSSRPRSPNAHRLAIAVDAANEADETVAVGRRLELGDDLAGVGEQADVETIAAQI